MNYAKIYREANEETSDRMEYEEIMLGDTATVFEGEKGTVVYLGTLEDCIENSGFNDSYASLSDWEEYADAYDRPLAELPAMVVSTEFANGIYVYDDIAVYYSDN